MTFGLALTFIFLVFWRPQEWLVTQMYGWPLLQLIVFISGLALLIELNSGVVKLPRTPALALTIGLWVATLVSHLAHFYYQGLMDTIPETFKFSLFLVLLMTVVDSAERARTAVMVIVAGCCVMCVHALLQQYRGYGFAGAWPYFVQRQLTGVWELRSMFFGIFGDPNDLAQMLAAAIPLAFAIPRQFSLGGLLVAFAVAALLLMGLWSTHSRGGDVALIAVVAAMVFMLLPPRWMPVCGVLGLIAGLGLCMARGGGMLDASAQERIVYWGLANRAFKSNPIFGLGYGMFWQVTATSRAAHNAFVSCYTEVGLVGYWFWFSLLQLGIVGCWRARRALRRAVTGRELYVRRLAGLSIASVIGFSAGGYFLSRAFLFPFFFLFGLVNAVPLIAQKLLPDDHPPLLNARTDVFGWGTASALFSVAYIYVTILILNRVYYG